MPADIAKKSNGRADIRALEFPGKIGIVASRAGERFPGKGASVPFLRGDPTLPAAASGRHRSGMDFFTSSVFFEPKNPDVLGWGGPDAAMALIAR